MLMLGVMSMASAAYIPTAADAALMDTLETKVDSLAAQDLNRVVMIGNKIVDVLPLIQDPRAFYVLNELYVYIDMTRQAMVAAPAETTEIPVPEAVVPDRVIDVTGENYAFSVPELIVNQGDVIQINFISTSGFHDWVLDEFDAATEKVHPEDGMTSVTFTASEA